MNGKSASNMNEKSLLRMNGETPSSRIGKSTTRMNGRPAAGCSYSFVGIDHVQVAAPPGGEREAIYFYAGCLGFEQLEKPADLQKRGGVWFRCGAQQLHVGISTAFAAADKAHPAFEVEGLPSLKAKLVGLGIAVTEDEHRVQEGIARFFTNDPFGNRLEFMEMCASE